MMTRMMMMTTTTMMMMMIIMVMSAWMVIKENDIAAPVCVDLLLL